MGVRAFLVRCVEQAGPTLVIRVYMRRHERAGSQPSSFVPALAVWPVIFGFRFNNSSRAYSSGRLRASDFFASCGSVSDLPRRSKRFSCASYLATPERGGVSLDKPPAREGRMSSILLLPEQAASALPKINNATMRIMTGGLRGRSFTAAQTATGLSEEIEQG